MKKPTEKDIQKFIENRCSKVEHDNMLDFLHTLSDEDLNKFMGLHFGKIERADLSKFTEYNYNFNGLLDRIKSDRNTFSEIRSRKRKPYFAVAAAIIFLMIISVSVFYYLGLFNKSNDSNGGL